MDSSMAHRWKALLEKIQRGRESLLPPDARLPGHKSFESLLKLSHRQRFSAV